MRNIAFSMTTRQVRARTKTVTRRTGWDFAHVGMELQGIERGQGLRKGEKVIRLARIRLVDVRREPLQQMLDDLEYGQRECILEGFPELTPAEFVAHFMKGHRGVTASTPLARLEFAYVDADQEPQS